MRNPAFHKLLEEIAELHDSKNTDYATIQDPLANLKDCERLGQPAVLGTVVRLQDKMRRIENFFSNGHLRHEAVRDSFIDLAVYALLGVVILDEKTGNKP
jgi:hypothetical protein|tara:strand:- start:265 stop:564 length:300 start_codon:yes stop_codon:yes gene_type:complete